MSRNLANLTRGGAGDGEIAGGMCSVCMASGALLVPSRSMLSQEGKSHAGKSHAEDIVHAPPSAIL